MIRVISEYNHHLSLLVQTTIPLLFCLAPSPGQAQITNDSTLPVNSQVNLNGNSFKIDGGTVNNNQTNLFHSFSEFSIPTNFEAFFNNSVAIENIFARVTGSQISNIDGLIRANGTANLFLINPNGIIYGANASLDIGGSLINTTANSIIFTDGGEFSATNPRTFSPLTVNIPIGLQFRQNQGQITVQNTGHQLFRVGDLAFELILSPILGRELTSGLEVNSGNTLAFVGGSVMLDGGIVRAEQGNIELGSVSSGIVALQPNSLGWKFDYSQVNSFSNMQFLRQALVDVSGNQSGSIQVQGSTISLNDGSTILSQNQGVNTGRNLDIRASQLLEIKGASLNGRITSQITSIAEGSGQGGSINVVTPKLLATSGGRIGTLVLSQSSAKGGNITVNATDSIDLIGSSIAPALRASQIITETSSFAFGETGDINISTGRLSILNGANIVAGINIGNGSTSVVNINATEFFLIQGIGVLPSLVGGGSIAGAGNVGRLTINTPKLVVREGGNINTSVLAQGNAGDIVINASDSVEVTGDGSEIISAAQLTPPIFVLTLGLPNSPSGFSGNVTINTSSLSLIDGGQVTVRNDGDGDAGNLVINSNSILLNRSNITASTKSGKGGNIQLDTNDLLRIRDESLINATAGELGNGGNIKINSPLLAVFSPSGANGSDIVANAERGTGGNISINAQGIFGISEGLAIQGNQSNDIDASSEFGTSGQVEITSTIDPNRGVIQLPEAVIDPNALVAQNPCKRGSKSQFTRSGRGGLPPSINEDLSGEATQVGLVTPATTNSVQQETKKVEDNSMSSSSEITPIIPTQGWIFNEKGEVVLVAYDPTTITETQRLKEKITGCPVP